MEINTFISGNNSYDQLELKNFEYTDHNIHDLENDIDLDNNFFSAINNNCCYYTNDQYNQKIKAVDNLSIIHFNSRSLYENFSHIREYLHQFSQPFNIIAISETWITADKGMDFEMEGYELRYMNRKNKGGGGVAIYVDRNLKFRVLSDMTAVVDNVLECISIEIIKEKSKNVIISCIYRAPGSNIEIFKDWMEETFSCKSTKEIFICGDFNINLLHTKEHKMTEEFINAMYSMALYPKIMRPTRITSHCATLIDNIFTNNIEDSIISGILINDISDHLPVFTIYDRNCRNITLAKKSQYRRVRTEQSINSFKNDLLTQSWDAIYQSNNIDSAYEEFLKIFTTLYNKNCPIKQYTKKIKKAECPWLTKGLINACSKKNTLYREFIKYKTQESENKYKKSKNKLTNILRASKKEY